MLEQLRFRSMGTAMALGVVCTVALGACGGDSPADSPPAAKKTQATKGSSAAGSPVANGCPIALSDLSSITGMQWELRQRRVNHPLETLESVRATACVYTADVQINGDPLVFRTDAVAASDASAVRKQFTDSCAEAGGTKRDATAGTASCERNGIVVEGIVKEGEVSAYFVNADTATAQRLTPVFERILDATK